VNGERPVLTSEADHLRLAQMFANHHVIVWRSLRRRGLRPDEAADATQETFLIALLVSEYQIRYPAGTFGPEVAAVKIEALLKRVEAPRRVRWRSGSSTQIRKPRWPRAWRAWLACRRHEGGTLSRPGAMATSWPTQADTEARCRADVRHAVENRRRELERIAHEIGADRHAERRLEQPR
jgi:hypothetical protein